MKHDTVTTTPAARANGVPADIQTRPDFITFLRESLRELRDKPETWENNTLPLFLEALAAWTEDLDGFYQNQGRTVPNQPSWQMLAEMFQAARGYE
jgi:hypothetical protein